MVAADDERIENSEEEPETEPEKDTFEVPQYIQVGIRIIQDPSLGGSE